MTSDNLRAWENDKNHDNGNQDGHSLQELDTIGFRLFGGLCARKLDKFAVRYAMTIIRGVAVISQCDPAKASDLAW